MESRFSYYDQVNCTGMDIPQAASAIAVLTLGKDLTFRDAAQARASFPSPTRPPRAAGGELTAHDRVAQAAYRMRGIGKGQRIVLFVPPEVKLLLTSEAAKGRGVSLEGRCAELGATAEGEPRLRAQLEDVSAWLMINSMRTEKIQFELWCAQCAHNVWRKRAFGSLRQPQAHASLAAKDAKGAKPEAVKASARRALDVFREPVVRDVSNTVPRVTDLRREIATAAGAHSELLEDANDVQTIEK